MSNDSDWVDDVKRWYFSGGAAAAARALRVHDSDGTEATEFAVGYEAAHPALVAGPWADPPPSGFDHSA